MQEDKDEGLVEVQRPDTKAWYQVRIIAVKDDKFIIKYEDPKMGKDIEEVGSSLIRPRPRITDKSRIEFNVDEFVEVFTRNQKWEAEGWWKAIIKNKKGNFFYVAYENSDKYDEIVEKNRLRPINTRETLNAKDYIQTQIPISSELLEWAQNIEESNKSLNEILVKSNSLIVSFDKERKSIIVVGKEENVETAKILIDVVLSHQSEVLQHYAANKEEMPGIDNITEFVSLEEEILDRLGGLEGDYLRNVKAKYKVDLELTTEEAVGGKYKIAITGASEKMVQSAKKEVQLNNMIIPLKEKQLTYLRTKLLELQQKSKIVGIVENPGNENNGPTLNAIGTEDSLKNFRLAIETLLSYEAKYQGSEEIPKFSEPSPPPQENEAEIEQKEKNEPQTTTTEAAPKVYEKSYTEQEYTRQSENFGRGPRGGRGGYRRGGQHGPIRYIKKYY